MKSRTIKLTLEQHLQFQKTLAEMRMRLSNFIIRGPEHGPIRKRAFRVLKEIEFLLAGHE